MPEPEIHSVVASTRDYYDGPADQIYRSIWGDNIHLGVPCSDSCPHPEAMEHTNQIMAEAVGLTPSTRVLDLGCGYGSTARYLAEYFSCRVTGTNISEKELELASDRAKESGLEDLLFFEYGDFHDLKYSDASYDVVWSQEAFLHGVDKNAILSECYRVLVPGGALAFTDILVRRATPEADRQRIYDRVKSPDMWDLDDYKKAIGDQGFRTQQVTDWSQYVGRSYSWVRERLSENREVLLPRIGAEAIDRTLDALAFWVASANAGNIGWAFFLAYKPE
jgi:sarcosine/dimethylglycine N-methyltransferase